MVGGCFIYLLALLVPYAVNAAVISLFIPDGQGQSLSVDNLGTDSGGHTTWAIGIAGATPTVPSEAPGIATMVAGPTDLHLVEDVRSALGGILHDDCGISGGVAVCTIVMSSSAGVRTVAVKTESASAFEVQIATAPSLGPSVSGTQSAGGSATGTAATAAGTASTGTNSGDSAGPSAQTVDGHQNAAHHVSVSLVSGSLAVGAVVMALSML